MATWCRKCWERVYLVQDEYGNQFYVSVTGKVKCVKRRMPPGWRPFRR